MPLYISTPLLHQSKLCHLRTMPLRLLTVVQDDNQPKSNIFLKLADLCSFSPRLSRRSVLSCLVTFNCIMNFSVDLVYSKASGSV